VIPIVGGQATLHVSDLVCAHTSQWDGKMLANMFSKRNMQQIIDRQRQILTSQIGSYDTWSKPKRATQSSWGVTHVKGKRIIVGVKSGTC
jgi:hypothetical protein